MILSITGKICQILYWYHVEFEIRYEPRLLRSKGDLCKKPRPTPIFSGLQLAYPVKKILSPPWVQLSVWHSRERRGRTLLLLLRWGDLSRWHYFIDHFLISRVNDFVTVRWNVVTTRCKFVWMMFVGVWRKSWRPVYPLIRRCLLRRLSTSQTLCRSLLQMAKVSE